MKNYQATFVELLEKKELNDSEQEQLTDYLIGLAIHQERKAYIAANITIPDLTPFINEVEEEKPIIQLLPIINETQSFNEEEESHTPVIKSFWKKAMMPLGMAASLLIAVLSVWQITKTQTDLQRAEGYIQEENAFIPTSRKGDDTLSDNWEQAKRYIADKSYRQGIKVLEAIDKRTPEQEFFLGLCYLKAIPKDYNKSISAFKSVYNQQKDNDETRDARWLLALAYISNRQSEQAKPLLEEIVQEANKNARTKVLAQKAAILLKNSEIQTK